MGERDTAVTLALHTEAIDELTDRLKALETGATPGARGLADRLDRIEGRLDRLAQGQSDLERWREDEEEAKTVRVYVPAPGPCSRLGDVTAKLDAAEFEALGRSIVAPGAQAARSLYAIQLEGQLAEKDKEIASLRAQVRALVDDRDAFRDLYLRQREETAKALADHAKAAQERDALRTKVLRVVSAAMTRDHLGPEVARKALVDINFIVSLKPDGADFAAQDGATPTEVMFLKAEVEKERDEVRAAHAEIERLRVAEENDREDRHATRAERDHARSEVERLKARIGDLDRQRVWLEEQHGEALRRGDTYKRRCEAATVALGFPAGADPRTVFQQVAGILSGKLDVP